MIEFLNWLAFGRPWQITLSSYVVSVVLSYLLVRFTLVTAVRKDHIDVLQFQIEKGKRTADGDCRKFSFHSNIDQNHEVGRYFWLMFIPLLNFIWLSAAASYWYFTYFPLDYRRVFLLGVKGVVTDGR